MLISSKERHFIVTYTDYEKNFNDPNNERFNEAWASFLSIKLDSPTPARFGDEMLILGGIVALLLLFMMLKFIKGFVAGRSYMSEVGGGDGNYSTSSSMTPLSNASNYDSVSTGYSGYGDDSSRPASKIANKSNNNDEDGDYERDNDRDNENKSDAVSGFSNFSKF
jgi:hypothetical protein